MLVFNYQVKDRLGKPLKGVIEANNQTQAVRILHDRQLIVVSLKEIRKRDLSQIFSFLKRVTHNDVVNFTRQLSTMITAGLPLNEALILLEKQSNPGIAKILSEVAQDIQAGTSLSEALKKHPKVFKSTYIALVKSGEAGGVMEKVLKSLADNLEKEKEFRSKVKGAMMYPAIIVVGMVLVMIIMMIFVVPNLLLIFKDFDIDIPFGTRALMFISDIFSKFWFLIPVFIFGVSYGFNLIKKTESGREKIDKLIMKIPIIGNLRKKMILTDLTRTLSLLVGTGVSIVEGLKIVSEASSSIIFEKALKEVGSDVEKGLPLAGSLERFDFFPALVPQMVAVGEETGKLDEVLAKVSHYFEMEAEQAVKTLTTAIEPIMLVILGLGVAFLVSAVILPIYSITDAF